jgi:hypothetical protein
VVISDNSFSPASLVVLPRWIALLDELFRIGLALGGRFHVAVDQDHRNAGLRRHIGNACAHEACANHADLA